MLDKPVPIDFYPGLLVFVMSGLDSFGSIFVAGMLFQQVFVGEFDPGSGRTLAACLTHASRAERPFRGYSSGERVSNT